MYPPPPEIDQQDRDILAIKCLSLPQGDGRAVGTKAVQVIAQRFVEARKSAEGGEGAVSSNSSPTAFGRGWQQRKRQETPEDDKEFAKAAKFAENDFAKAVKLAEKKAEKESAKALMVAEKAAWLRSWALPSSSSLPSSSRPSLKREHIVLRDYVTLVVLRQTRGFGVLPVNSP